METSLPQGETFHQAPVRAKCRLPAVERELGQGPHFLWELTSLDKESQELPLRQPDPTSSSVTSANTLAVTPQPQTEPQVSALHLIHAF